MNSFGKHLRHIEPAVGIGDHESKEFRNRYRGAHKIITGPKYRRSNKELKTARALGAWRALNAGHLSPEAAAGVRRDYVQEFRVFAKDPSLLTRK